MRIRMIPTRKEKFRKNGVTTLRQRSVPTIRLPVNGRTTSRNEGENGKNTFSR